MLGRSKGGDWEGGGAGGGQPAFSDCAYEAEKCASLGGDILRMLS